MLVFPITLLWEGIDWLEMGLDGPMHRSDERVWPDADRSDLTCCFSSGKADCSQQNNVWAAAFSLWAFRFVAAMPASSCCSTDVDRSVWSSSSCSSVYGCCEEESRQTVNNALFKIHSKASLRIHTALNPQTTKSNRLFTHNLKHCHRFSLCSFGASASYLFHKWQRQQSGSGFEWRHL